MDLIKHAESNQTCLASAVLVQQLNCMVSIAGYMLLLQACFHSFRHSLPAAYVMPCSMDRGTEVTSSRKTARRRSGRAAMQTTSTMQPSKDAAAAAEEQQRLIAKRDYQSAAMDIFGGISMNPYTF